MKAVAADVAALVERLLDGDRRALGRAISLVEQGGPDAEELVRATYARGIDGWVVGVTGSAGSGKSTLVDRLVVEYRDRDERVGVVAIDPTSPFSGGALLGDRVRMQRHSTDAGVFVRSMATRGQLGGLAAAAYDALNLLASAGFGRLVLETVGVGQEEIDVVGVAHTTCVLMTPGTGDDIQAIKAGIMEIADVFVLNKADQAGADRAEAQLRAVLDHGPDGWVPPIVRTVATSGDGTAELRDAIAAHEEWARGAGKVGEKRRAVAALRLRRVLGERLLERARRHAMDEARERELVEAIAAGELDPYSAADRVVAALDER